jgi:uncharacterized membrane protein YgaE (UPF0421/DUF939 family)
MKSRHFEALIFSTKAAVGALLAVFCSDLVHLPGMIWAPISAVVVTEKELHPSFKTATFRILANLIGAFIGAALSTLFGHNLPSLAVGILLTGLTCHFARLGEAMRPAYAAVVIVILSGEGQAWTGSLDRVTGVAIGCVAALVVGFVFDKASGVWLADPEAKDKR